MINIARLRAGHRQSLAKAITLVESTRAEDRPAAAHLLEQVAGMGHAFRLGITGAPGVGKSTLIERLGAQIIAHGHKLAVLSIDPSSHHHGGSILADKTRMPELAAHAHAFIRPTPTAAVLGGVARRTHDAIVLCEAAGYDVVVVETVGVGQSEIKVSEMTDLFLLMLLPGAGDSLQGIKRGVMERADVIIINKADGDLQVRAARTAADIQPALQLLTRHPPAFQSTASPASSAAWSVPVMTASALTGSGITELWRVLGQYQQWLAADDRFARLRRWQAKQRLWGETVDLLVARLQSANGVQQLLPVLQGQVAAGEMTAQAAATQLVDRLCTPCAPRGDDAPVPRSVEGAR